MRAREEERERVRPCEGKSLVREGSSERNPTLRSGAEEGRAVVYPEPHHRSCVCTRGFARVSVHKREGVRAYSTVTVSPVCSLSSRRDEELCHGFCPLAECVFQVTRNRRNRGERKEKRIDVSACVLLLSPPSLVKLRMFAGSIASHR